LSEIVGFFSTGRGKRRKIRPVHARYGKRGHSSFRITAKRRQDLWISESAPHLNEGALSHQLGIPVKDKIPTTLLERIVDVPIGSRVENPTEQGRRRFKVTRKLKQRALWALNVRRATTD